MKNKFTKDLPDHSIIKLIMLLNNNKYNSKHLNSDYNSNNELNYEEDY